MERLHHAALLCFRCFRFFTDITAVDFPGVQIFKPAQPRSAVRDLLWINDGFQQRRRRLVPVPTKLPDRLRQNIQTPRFVHAVLHREPRLERMRRLFRRPPQPVVRLQLAESHDAALVQSSRQQREMPPFIRRELDEIIIKLFRHISSHTEPLNRVPGQEHRPALYARERVQNRRARLRRPAVPDPSRLPWIHHARYLSHGIIDDVLRVLTRVRRRRRRVVVVTEPPPVRFRRHHRLLRARRLEHHAPRAMHELAHSARFVLRHRARGRRAVGARSARVVQWRTRRRRFKSRRVDARDPKCRRA